MKMKFQVGKQNILKILVAFSFTGSHNENDTNR